MRAYLFLLLICPVMLIAQEQPVNGATDCPTFGKNKVKNKAGMFAYMRTHKPQKMDVTQKPAVYQTSALPDLTKAHENRENSRYNRNNQQEAAKKQRPLKESKIKQPAVAKEENSSDEDAVVSAAPVKKEEKPVVKEETQQKEITYLEKNSAREEAKEKRDKKAKRAALKAKMQRIFKSNKKRTSRKNVQKCPSF